MWTRERADKDEEGQGMKGKDKGGKREVREDKNRPAARKDMYPPAQKQLS